MSIQYREVKRKADVGERIRIVNTGDSRYKIGDEFVVERVRPLCAFVKHPQGCCDGCASVFDSEYVVLEPIAQQTLDFPEELTQSLALFVRENAAAIRKYLDEIAPVAQPVTETKPLSRAEEKPDRATVIAKAKADVAELERIGGISSADLPKGTPFNDRFYNVEFRVNREKRAVTALVRTGVVPSSRKPDAKATAKCAPGDVFHAEIGKAIALRRALGLTVPDEYVNAPKPDEPRVGAKVRKLTGSNIGTIMTLEQRTPWNDGAHYGDYAFTTVEGGWVGSKQYEVIDDTDVDYGTTERSAA